MISLAQFTRQLRVPRLKPEVQRHDGCQATVGFWTLGELVEVTPCLCQNHVPGHVLREGVQEQEHQLIHVHWLVHRSLPVYGHDGDADEEVKGFGFVLAPAGLPDEHRVRLTELSFEKDKKPSVAEHQIQSMLELFKIAVKLWK